MNNNNNNNNNNTIVIIVIIIIIFMLSIKGPLLTSFTCIFLRLWPTDIMTTLFFFS